MGSEEMITGSLAVMLWLTNEISETIIEFDFWSIMSEEIMFSN